MAYVTPRGDMRSVGSSSARIPHDRDPTSVEKPISFALWRHQDHPISIKAEDRDRRLTMRFVESVWSSSNGRWNSIEMIVIRSRLDRRWLGPSLTWARSDDGEASWKNSMIAVRSNCDRSTIEPWSWHLWREIVATIAADWGAMLADDRGHHQATMIGSNAPKNRARNLL